MEITLVLPYSATENENNHLVIGGCDVVELAAEYGTPLFIYDEDMLRRQCREYIKEFTSRYENSEVIYASKAFISLAMCQLIAQEGLSIDVMTGGELFLALKGGIDPAKIYMHGNNKTPAELQFAIESNIGYIVADSFDELGLLEGLARDYGRKIRILLRITPGIKPSTHSYVQTGQIDSKFGFGIHEELAMNAVKQALVSENIELAGLHFHIGSQIFALHSYAKAVEVVADFVSDIKDATGYEVGILNTGGGLGVKYQADDEPATIAEYAEIVIENVRSEFARHKLAEPRIMVEPGRSIVANACVTAYTVGTVKHIPGIRTYVSVDGGMSDNLRPILYDSKYEAIIANKVKDIPDTTATIAGKHCESGDILIENALIPEPKAGDILVTPATGAYGYSMANNYNRQPRPAVLFVSEGKAQMVIRRETYEDFLALERPLT